MSEYSSSSRDNNLFRMPPLLWNEESYEEASVTRVRSKVSTNLISGTNTKFMNVPNWATEGNQTDTGYFEIEITKDIQYELIEKYKKIAMQVATVEQLDDGSWYAELPGFPGVWAEDEKSAENALSTLEEVLDDWIVIKIQMNDGDIPVLDEIDLN